VRHSTHREYVFFATTRIFCFEAGLLARRERGRKGASEATIRRTLGTQRLREREKHTKRTNFSHHRHFNAQNTFTHTPPTKKKYVSLFARARECFHRANSRSNSRRRVRVRGFRSRTLFARCRFAFFVFFLRPVCVLVSEFAVSRRARQRRRRRRESNERERKKRKRRPEFGNKTDDSPRDARDSSARRTIFGSRALPLSLLR